MHKRKGMVTLEPLDGLPLVDAHCHIPWISRRKNALDPDGEYEKFVKNNGAFIITSSISWDELETVLSFCEGKPKVYLAAGWAPQTVTYTKEPIMSQNFKKWKDWIENTLLSERSVLTFTMPRSWRIEISKLSFLRKLFDSLRILENLT